MGSSGTPPLIASPSLGNGSTRTGGIGSPERYVVRMPSRGAQKDWNTVGVLRARETSHRRPSGGRATGPVCACPTSPSGWLPASTESRDTGAGLTGHVTRHESPLNEAKGKRTPSRRRTASAPRPSWSRAMSAGDGRSWPAAEGAERQERESDNDERHWSRRTTRTVRKTDRESSFCPGLPEPSSASRPARTASRGNRPRRPLAAEPP